MKTIGVVTVGRSDYGIYRPLLQKLNRSEDFELQLYVSGSHLAPEHGETVHEIERDRFPIAAQIPVLTEGDNSLAIARAIANGTKGFGEFFHKNKPDLLVVLGDRFEMFAAVISAVPFGLPILHLHGGELTEGAIDDCFRHSITKMSHLHAVSTETYRKRVIQLGEEPWRVQLCGALALDNLSNFKPLSAPELAKKFGLVFDRSPILVTLHPTTNESGSAEDQAAMVLAALKKTGHPLVFTLPNADMDGRKIRAKIEAYCRSQPGARLVENFGPENYFSMLSCASAMVGNSSSGILEAPSFALPVLNIGSRQEGRLRAANVADVPFDPEQISQGLKKILSPEFRKSLNGLKNPYGDGQAAERILKLMAQGLEDPRLLQKKFHNL